VLLLGVATVGMLRQRVDPTNHALKDPTSRDADALRELHEVVGDDPILLLGFTTRGGLPMADADRGHLERLRVQLATQPDVRAATAIPLADEGLAVFSLELTGDEAHAAGERAIATADAEKPPTVDVHAAGLSHLEGTIAARIAAERARVVPIVIAVLALALACIYRHATLVVAALLPAIAAIVTLEGALGWLGHPLDPIASMLDPVLLTIGVGGSAHFIQSFRLGQAAGLTNAAAAASAARDVLHPALLATATTMIGLWSVGISSIPAVVDFGMRGALGVALTNAFAFWLLPGVLGSFAPPAVAGSTSARQRSANVRRWRVPILVGTTAATAWLLAGVFALRGDNDPLRVLPAGERAQRDHEALATRLGGIEVCHLLVPERSRAAEPSRLLPFVAAVRAEPGIAGLAGEMVRSPSGALAIPLLLAPGGSAQRTALFDDIDRTARALGLENVRVAGAAVQIARDSDRLLQTLGTSVFLTIPSLWLAMAFALRSWRLAILALLPNLLPAIWLYGGMGWIGRPVSVATAMIGSTLLGIIVDNTIHLLHAILPSRGAARHPHGVAEALARRGPAIHTSSLVLMLGFLATTISGLGTTVEFAVLAAATIGIAWFATAIVLPLLLSDEDDRGAMRDAVGAPA